MLRIGAHVRVYIAGLQPQVKYAEVRDIVGTIVLLDDGANTYRVARTDIRMDECRLWLIN